MVAMTRDRVCKQNNKEALTPCQTTVIPHKYKCIVEMRPCLYINMYFDVILELVQFFHFLNITGERDKKSIGSSTRHKSYIGKQRYTCKENRYIPVKTIDLPSFLCLSYIGRGCFSDTEKKTYKSHCESYTKTSTEMERECEMHK